MSYIAVCILILCTFSQAEARRSKPDRGFRKLDIADLTPELADIVAENKTGRIDTRRGCSGRAKLGSRQYATVSSDRYPGGYDRNYKYCWYLLEADKGSKIKMSCQVSIPYCNYGKMVVYTDLFTSYKTTTVCGQRKLESYEVISSAETLFVRIFGYYTNYKCRFDSVSSNDVATTTTAKPTTASGPTTTTAARKCGVSAGSKKIVGGTKVESNKVYPWQAALQYGSQRFCGAALLSADWVVSAAHCIVVAADRMKVFLGDLKASQTDDGEVTRDVSQIIRHADYNNAGTYNDDIALIKLKSPVTFTDTVTPICLPCSFKTTDFNGKDLTVAGWGHLEEYSSSGSDDLMQVSVPIVSNDYCKSKYGSYVRATSMCAGEEEGGKDSCQGDSGGPGVWSNNDVSYLLGVISFGAGCARAGYPGVYTRVTEYIKWIEENTGETFC